MVVLCLDKFWSKDDLGEGTRTDPNGAELGAQRTAARGEETDPGDCNSSQ